MYLFFDTETTGIPRNYKASVLKRTFNIGALTDRFWPTAADPPSDGIGAL